MTAESHSFSVPQSTLVQTVRSPCLFIYIVNTAKGKTSILLLRYSRSAAPTAQPWLLKTTSRVDAETRCAYSGLRELAKIKACQHLSGDKLNKEHEPESML